MDFTRKCDSMRSTGSVAEWLKAPHSKCGIRETVSRVQISPLPRVEKTVPLGRFFLRGSESALLTRGFEGQSVMRMK